MKKHFSPEITAKYSMIKDDSKVNLDKFKSLRGKNFVLSQFCGVPSAKRAKLARMSAQARARGEDSKVGRFSQVNAVQKMQTRRRPVKYPKMSKVLTDFILEGWYSGAPVTRHGCYQKAMEVCEEAGGFYNQYINPNKVNAPAQLSHWLTRLLKRIGFSSRKETVSQKVQWFLGKTPGGWGFFLS